MSVAEKLTRLKEKINNNISAVRQRHTYTGNSVDVSNDILAISSKPYGQCVTFLRRPYYLAYSGDFPTYWTNIDSNSVKGNSENPIVFTYGMPSSNTFIKLKNKNGELLYTIKPNYDPNDTNYKETVIRFTGLENEFNLCLDTYGDYTNKIVLKYSYGDFVPKSNCITEIVIEYSYSPQGAINGVYNFHKILVRYTNP